jgi:putative inorganic carbon (HCO3(-)) transporter
VSADPKIQWWRPVPVGEAGTWSVTATPTSDSPVPFWALFAFTFILLLSPQTLIPFLAPLRIALLSAGLAILFYVSNRFAHHMPIVRMTREIRLALLLLTWAVVTVPFSYWPGGTVTYLVGLYVKSLLVFVLLSQVITSVTRLRTLAWGLALMAIPIALSGIHNYLSGNFMQDIGSDARIQGYDAPLTGNPNDLALTLNLILPLAIALYQGSRKRGVRAALGALIGLMIVAIVFTFSRGGFLTLAVTLGIYLWFLCKRRGAGWAVLVVALLFAAIPFLPSTYFNRIGTITEIEADTSGSAQERWTYIKAAAVYTAYHPLVGAGAGMNMLALNEMKGPMWKEVHNVYLQYASELGIPGLLLFLLLLRGCIKSVRDVERRPGLRASAPELFYLAEGIRVSLIAFAVAALFHPVAYHFYFYYFAGLALAARSIADGLTNDTNTQPHRGNA